MAVLRLPQAFVAAFVAAAALVVAAPITSINSAGDNLNNVDLAVFDQDSANSADTNKNYVIFAYDDAACANGNAAKCAALEESLNSVIGATKTDTEFQKKYGETTVFGKANKDAFPDHKQDFEKARVPLPAVLFWPAGHSRPSCKYDADAPTGTALREWLDAKLKEEEDDDDSLLQIDEGVAQEDATAAPATPPATPEEPSALEPAQAPAEEPASPASTQPEVVEPAATQDAPAVTTETAEPAPVAETAEPASVTADTGAAEEAAPAAIAPEGTMDEAAALEAAPASPEAVAASAEAAAAGDAGADVAEDESLLFCKVSEAPADATVAEARDEAQVNVQVDKTEQIYSFKEGSTIYTGPADNSLPKDVTDTSGPVNNVNAASFQGLAAQNKYLLMYFKAEWCKYCGCLPPVFDKIAGNLITSKRQPNLIVATVDGDKSPALRDLFKVEVYPTILLVNRDATKVLGRYLGPRKNYEISNWVEDLIVADENPIVKQDFDPQADKPATHDLYPVFPYEGKAAFGEQGLLAVSAQAQLGGSDLEECLATDESKFTAPGAALLIHYSSDSNYELDSSTVSTSITPTKLTVIDFYEPWCPHCQKLHPVWDKVAKQYADKDVVVGKVNLENHPDVKKMFGIRKFPTIVYFEPGKPMQYSEDRRYVGRRSEDALDGWVSGLMSSTAAASTNLQQAAPQQQLQAPEAPAVAATADSQVPTVASSDAPQSLPTERQ